jgi:hypothetical protein
VAFVFDIILSPTNYPAVHLTYTSHQILLSTYKAAMHYNRKGQFGTWVGREALLHSVASDEVCFVAQEHLTVRSTYSEIVFELGR